MKQKVITSKERALWEEAIDDELRSHKKNTILEILLRTANKNIVIVKYVLSK